MLIRVKLGSLKRTHGYEYVVRFGLGGLATVAAGLIADHFGPAVGGLFLAFPAIFCASATLIEKHERERKEKCGLKGAERGRGAAALDAAGAFWGSMALIVFAVLIWMGADAGAAVTLTVATAFWLAVAVALFFLRRHLCRG